MEEASEYLVSSSNDPYRKTKIGIAKGNPDTIRDRTSVPSDLPQDLPLVDEEVDLPNHRLPEPETDEHPTSKISNLEDQNPFEKLAIPLTTRVKQVWAVGGGKGGVGKSLVASNLAISLSRMGHTVTAVDLDLGGANLHTALGVDLPHKTLSDFFSGRVEDLQDCVTRTGVPNLRLISGAQDAIGAANITFAQKVRLMEALRDLDSDYLILDLGAGTNINTLDFFIFSDLGMVVLLPEPTSIENGYRFIKGVYYRRLRFSENLRNVRSLIQMAMDSKNPLGIKNPSDLFREINKASPEAAMQFKKEIEKIRLKLVVNQTRTQTDIDIGFSVKSICKKYFGIEMDYVGYLDHDSSVWQAVRRKRPLMLEFPNSQLVSSVDRITNYLVKRHGRVRAEFF